MSKKKVNDFKFEDNDIIPIPIQTFLWRQTCPFIRAKLWKQCETSCVSFERVIVQNILHALSPSLCEAIESISRWRLIKAALPHVIHCCKTMLERRKDSNIFEKFTSSEIKLLYTLHWIILDAASECEDFETDCSHNVNSFHNYLHTLDTIQLFVYLLIPLISQLRESDFNNLKLESGQRIWQSLWQFQQPDIACFSTPVKAKLANLKMQRNFLKVNFNIANIYIGKGTSNDDIYLGFDPPEDVNDEPARATKDSPSAPLAHMSDICAISANATYLSNDFPCNQCMDAEKCFCNECSGRKMSVMESIPSNVYDFPYVSNPDVLHATYFDVAVLQCLFQPQWSEEGVDWALQYLLRRIIEISIELRFIEQHRERSKSLPVSEYKINLQEDKYGFNNCRKDSASVEAICIASAQLPFHTSNIDLQISQIKLTNEGPFSNIAKPETNIPIMFQMDSIDSLTGFVEKGIDKISNKTYDQMSPVVNKNEFIKPTITVTQDLCETLSYPSNANWYFKNLSNVASSEKLNKDDDLVPHLHRCLTDSSINYTEMEEIEEVVGSTSYIQPNGEIKYIAVLRVIYNIASRKYKSNIYLNILKILEVFIDSDHKKLNSKGFFNKLDDILKLRPNSTDEQNDQWKVFCYSIETILKILSALGCMHGCGDQIKGNEGSNIRTLVTKLLSKLSIQYKGYFRNYMTKIFIEQPLGIIMHQMHSLLGFCLGPPLPSLQVPLGGKSGYIIAQSKSFGNNFGEEENALSIEYKIIRLSLKSILDKFVQERKELISHENIGLYCEIQLMINYVKQSHGSTFRCVALSGLIDCTKNNEDLETIETVNTQDTFSTSEFIKSRALFRKKNRHGTESHCDNYDERSLPRHSIISDTDEDITPQIKKKYGKLARVWRRSTRSNSEDDWILDDQNTSNLSKGRMSFKQATLRMENSRKRFDEAVRNVNKQHKETDGQFHQMQLNISVKSSELVHEKKLINCYLLKSGLLRFNFILESCNPGTMPDPLLIAALLDLDAPVVGRASLLLECAFFVSNCNRGEWPHWMRMNACGLTTRPNNTSIYRKTVIMQRNAGRLFHQWAVMLGNRLSEIIFFEDQTTSETAKIEEKKKEKSTDCDSAGRQRR